MRGGEPGQESKTFWPKILMIGGRVSSSFLSGIAWTSISHLVVRSLVSLMVIGAVSVGKQYSAITFWSSSIRRFLPLIGTLSSFTRTVGGSLPFGGRIGMFQLSVFRVPFLMKSSASVSSSKKIWINLVSALNLVPMAVSGKASAICFPLSVGGIFCKSRKAESLSVAGGILEEGGRTLIRLL